MNKYELNIHELQPENNFGRNYVIYFYFISKKYQDERFFVIEKNKNFNFKQIISHDNKLECFSFSTDIFGRYSAFPNFGIWEKNINSKAGQDFLKLFYNLKQSDDSWSIEKYGAFFNQDNYCKTIINGIQKKLFTPIPMEAQDSIHGCEVTVVNKKFVVKNHKMFVITSTEDEVPYVLFCKKNKAYYSLELDFENNEIKTNIVGNREMKPFYFDQNEVNNIINKLSKNIDIELHLIKEINFELTDVGKISFNEAQVKFCDLKEKFKKIYFN